MLFGSGLGCFVGIFLFGLLRLVGPVHLLSASTAEIGFRWDPLALTWSRPGLPLLSNLAGPVQHFRAAILDAWRNKVTADLCGRAGFRGGPLLDVHGSLQLPNSSHVRDRDKALLRSIMVGGLKWFSPCKGSKSAYSLLILWCGTQDPPRKDESSEQPEQPLLGNEKKKCKSATIKLKS